MIFKIDLSVYAFVGIILLVGLVKKNAIMMIDFALEAERSEGRAPADAIVHACLDPFPSDHDDDDGRADGHAADRAVARAPARSRGVRSASRWSADSRSRSSSRCT